MGPPRSLSLWYFCSATEAGGAKRQDNYKDGRLLILLTQTRGCGGDIIDEELRMHPRRSMYGDYIGSMPVCI